MIQSFISIHNLLKGQQDDGIYTVKQMGGALKYLKTGVPVEQYSSIIHFKVVDIMLGKT